MRRKKGFARNGGKSRRGTLNAKSSWLARGSNYKMMTKKTMRKVTRWKMMEPGTTTKRLVKERRSRRVTKKVRKNLKNHHGPRKKPNFEASGRASGVRGCSILSNVLKWSTTSRSLSECL